MNIIYDSILATLLEKQGIDFSRYRRETLQRRLDVRIAAAGAPSAEEYLEHLRRDPDESRRLANCIGLDVSSFFRDPGVFEAISRRVLPALLTCRQESGCRQVRTWSAGCASGEEPYTLAMILHRLLGPRLPEWDCSIFATDINDDALARAATGRFRRRSLESTQLAYLDEYFAPDGMGFRIRPWIQQMVRFSHDDLTAADRIAPVESVYGDFDLILCRNVLIYFSPDLHTRVLEKLHAALSPGGYLVLGPSESLGPLESRFLALDRQHRIWRKNG